MPAYVKPGPDGQPIIRVDFGPGQDYTAVIQARASDACHGAMTFYDWVRDNRVVQAAPDAVSIGCLPKGSMVNVKGLAPSDLDVRVTLGAINQGDKLAAEEVLKTLGLWVDSEVFFRRVGLFERQQGEKPATAFGVADSDVVGIERAKALQPPPAPAPLFSFQATPPNVKPALAGLGEVPAITHKLGGWGA